MLPSLLLTALLIAGAQAQDCPSNETATYTSNIPSALSVVTDNDPNFVYRNKNCTSTSQKLITDGWYSFCDTAYRSLCANLSPVSVVKNNWIWAFFTDSLGNTCQAGLYQPDFGLTPECYRTNFQTMMTTVQRRYASSTAEPPNRISVNIASSAGFPHTTVLYGDGLQGKTDGAAVAADYPSFVLQG